MGDGDRVNVHVDHPGGGVDALDNFVDTANSGDAGTNVEELVDPLLGKEGHGATEEGAVSDA